MEAECTDECRCARRRQRRRVTPDTWTSITLSLVTLLVGASTLLLLMLRG